MATQSCIIRLQRDYASIQKSPIPFIETHPSQEDILTWSFVITGPPSTPYHNGQYYGNIYFPKTFPYAPPRIRMSTPSDRFQTHMDICTTFTNLHPECWNPAWTIETILTGFLSFMTSNESTHGSVPGPLNHEQIKRRAMESRKWNSLELPAFRSEYPHLHAANLENERFTEQERRLLQVLEKSESAIGEEDASAATAGIQQASMTFEEHVNEDWEKYGSMDDDFDYYDDEGDEEMEDEQEEYETEDTERDTSEVEN